MQKDGSNKLIDAKIVPIITAPIIRQKGNFEKYKSTYRNLVMADELSYKDLKVTVDILIGNDYYDEIITPERIVVDDGLFLINSSVGWMFTGRLKRKADDDVEHSMLIEENDDLIQSSFWDLETIRIKHTTDEEENDEILERFQGEIKQNGRRYQVSWAWKLCKTELPSNYILAEARLRSLVNNLRKDGDIIRRYDEIIQKQINEGTIEEADKNREYLQHESVVIHYLPHHLVKTDNGSTKKLRIVYEGCAKTHKSKRSLNECLHQGKNVVANLCGILLTF